MNKAQAEALFREHFMPHIRQQEGRVIDKPLRRMVWNNFVDGLHRSGEITEHQMQTWDQPRGLEKWK